MLTLNRFIVYPSIQTSIKHPILSIDLKEHVFATAGSPFPFQGLASHTLFTLWTFSSHSFYQWIHHNVPLTHHHHKGHPYIFKSRWKEEGEEWLWFIHNSMV
jgi:hypothetical protein